jgi:surface antigen
MIRPNLGHAAAIALLFASTTWHAAPALADPPPWVQERWHERGHGHGHGRGHEGEHDDDRDRGDDDQYGRDGGYPPPPPVAALAPYGLDQRFCNRDLLGAALGGATGGLIGSNVGKGKGRTVATVGGVLVGLFVGGKIGRNMDQLDQACAGQVLEHAPDQQTIAWQGQNHDGNQDGYWVTPTRTYEAGDGRYCREYTSDAVIAGRRQQTYGTACRQPDGSWEIVK